MKNLELDYKEDHTTGEKGQILSCKDCGTTKLNVIQVDWTTYAKCPKCLKYTIIHDG